MNSADTAATGRLAVTISPALVKLGNSLFNVFTRIGQALAIVDALPNAGDPSAGNSPATANGGDGDDTDGTPGTAPPPHVIGNGKNPGTTGADGTDDTTPGMMERLAVP